MEIRRFGSVVYPPGGTFERRRQPWLQWVGVHAGEVLVIQDGREFLVERARHFFMMPGCAYVLRFSPRSDTRHSWIDLKGRVPAVLSPLSRCPASQPLGREQERLIEMLLGFNRGPTREKDPLFNDMAIAFLDDVLRQWKNAPRGLGETPAGRPEVTLTEEWMRAHLAEPLHLADLADEAGITREHLVRLFHKATGKTPMARLWELRVDRARELLSHTGLSLETIAGQTGFASVHHFSRRIKTQTGQPPAEYRRRSAGGAQTFPPAPRPRPADGAPSDPHPTETRRPRRKTP